MDVTKQIKLFGGTIMNNHLSVEVCVDYKNLSFVIHIESAWYLPSTVVDAADFEINEGYVTLDGEVSDIVNITSDDIDVIMLMTNDNEKLLEEMLKDEDILDRAFVAFAEAYDIDAAEKYNDMVAERYDYYKNKRHDSILN